jgi:CHAT domain-containing protein/tetratricopeptide (TPR) repeat protein
MLAARAFRIFLAFCLPAWSDAVSFPFDRVQEDGAFRNLFPAWTDSPIGDRIAELQSDIRVHPESAWRCRILLDLCLLTGRESAADAFFSGLSTGESGRRNGFWMLAESAAAQGSDSAAFDRYRKALSAVRPDFELLTDFLEFDCRHSWRYGAMDILRSMRLDDDRIRMASAIRSFLQQNDSEALRILEKSGCSVPDRTRFFELLGNCLFRENRLDAAGSAYRRGFDAARREDRIHDQAVFLLRLGILHRTQGRPDRALALFDSAETIASDLRDIRTLQKVFANRASVYAVQGRYRECLRLDERAIAIAEKLHDDLNLAEYTFNNAQVLYSTGNFLDALRRFNQSENLFTRFGMRKKLVEVEYRKACLFMTLHQAGLARTLLERALESARRNGLSSLQHEISTQLAIVLAGQNQFGDAKRMLEAAIRHFESEGNGLYGSYSLGVLAELHLNESDTAGAVRLYERALDCASRAGSETQAAWYQLTIAGLKMNRSHLDESIDIGLSVIPIASAENDLALLSTAFAQLGKAFRRKGDDRAAIRYNRLAIGIIDDIRRTLSPEPLRVGYFQSMCEASRELAACYCRQYLKTRDPALLDTLFECIEMNLARSLRDCSIPNKISDRDTAFYGMAGRLHRLQRRLRFESGSPDQRDSLLQHLQAARWSLINQGMRVRDDGTVGRSDERKAPSLGSIRKRLKSMNAGMILYRIEEHDSYAFVLTENTSTVVPLGVRPAPLRKSIDSLTAPLHRFGNASVSSEAFRADIAHRLYQRLFRPVESAVRLPPNVVIVPDIPITDLPFELMLKHAAAESRYFPGEPLDCSRDFLVNEYCLSYAPSASAIAGKKSISLRDPSITVFSNPFDNQPGAPNPSILRSAMNWVLFPLPYSDVEAREIGQLCRQTRIYRRSQATKNMFLKEASEGRILHFATHAFVDPSFDDFSGLVMAAGGDSLDDGLLMGFELKKLSLMCDLVTLSACETGCGQVVGGEGVLGLPRLFLKAGSRSVLMTLWKVDDRFASALMPVFYDRLINRNMTKAGALAEAKRAVLSGSAAGPGTDYTHPIYWASFVLYGDPGFLNRRGLPFDGRMAALLLAAALGSTGVIVYRKRKRV